MDDGRRQRKPFEPPPWEADRFEELARRRAEQEAEEAERAALAAGTAAVEVEAGPEAAAQAPEVTAPAEAPPEVFSEAQGPGDGAALDDKAVAAMLIDLSTQEGSTQRPVRQAARVAAVCLGGVGAVMLVSAAVIAARTLGARAVESAVGAGLIGLLGTLVTAFAVWLWVRANKG